MLSQEQLARYFDHQFSREERARLEELMAADPEAQRALADQENTHLALRLLFAPQESHERVKQSIFTVLRSASPEKLTAAVIADALRKPQPTQDVSVRERFVRFFRSWAEDLEAKVWPKVALAVLLLVCGVSALLLTRSDAPIAIGQFATVIGTPEVRRSRTQETFAAQTSTQVRLGDQIKTGDADKAEIAFKDGTTLRLNFNTVIEISRLKSADRGARASLLRPPKIALLRGQVWTKVQKLTNAPQYAIRTEAATAVARGTEFGVKIQNSSSTNSSAPTTVLTVKEGAVDFSNSHGSVRATAMTQSTASADAAPSQPVRLQVIKTFDLDPGKQVAVGPQTAALDFDASMAYPYGWPGFYLRTTQGDGLAGARQLRVIRVRPGSPADQAGMAVGDLVTHVNGRSVTNIEEVLRPLIQRQGASVQLGLARSEGSYTVSLTTIRNPDSLPLTDVPAELEAPVLDATWPLVEAACEDVISSNRWQELEQNFRRAMEGYPRVAALHNNLAVWYDTANKPGLAIQQLRLAVELRPDNPFYHQNLSSVLCGIGNFERCVEEAEAVVRLVPNWVPGIFQLALAYSFLDRKDDALAVLELGLATNRSSADLWGAKALILSTNQKPDEAAIAALKAIELEPSYGYFWSLLGLARWAHGDLAESEAAYRKAIELDPGDADAHHALAMDIISRLGNRVPEDVTDASPEEMAIEHWRERPADELAIIAEAERHARRAIELRKSFATAHKDLGQILLTRGAVDEAETILRKAMQIDPGGQAAANARNGLAYRFAQWGIRLDEALELAQQAAEIYPAGYIFDTLAVVHFRRGEWDQAEEAWKKCIELAGPEGDPAACFHLGKVYERKNQTASAIASYQEALRLRPDFPEASRALAKLPK